MNQARMTGYRYLLPAVFVLLLLASAAVVAERYDGVLDWSRRAVLGTPVSGVIATVHVEPGERVAAGQLLLVLDQRPFESVLQDRKAQLHKHRLQRDEARRELERNRELYARTVISTHDLQLAEIAAAVAEADHASAMAALDAARLELEYSELHAPFAGVVLDVPVSAGMSVINTEQATPLVVLAQPRPMLARVPVPVASVSKLTAAVNARVRLNGRQYPAVPAWGGAEPDAGGRYLLSFSFDPGDEPLRAGQPVEVIIE